MKIINEEQKEIILNRYKKGDLPSVIGDDMKISPHSIRAIIKEYKQTRRGGKYGLCKH